VTIFDYIKDILVTKKGDLPLDNYVPFLVSRWLSFINPQVGEMINQLNTKTLLEDKSLHYKLMLSLFPKMKYAPKINYVKKLKSEDIEPDKLVKALAQHIELSEREVLWLLRERSLN
jgi:hypothetical protein